MNTQDDTCRRCGRKIDHSRSAWLELSWLTGLYAESVDAAESQGSFEFGADCARAILANGGRLEFVGRAKGMNQ